MQRDGRRFPLALQHEALRVGVGLVHAILGVPLALAGRDGGRDVCLAGHHTALHVDSAAVEKGGHHREEGARTPRVNLKVK